MAATPREPAAGDGDGDDAESLADLVHLLVDEVNVKSVEMTDDLEAHATFRLQPDGRKNTAHYGPGIQETTGFISIPFHFQSILIACKACPACPRARIRPRILSRR